MKENRTILIVEDQFINRHHIKTTLLSLGFESILEAGDSAEAINHLNSGGIDLAILDINLEEEDRDGIWIANQINKEFNIPFIFLTAYYTPEVRNRAIQAMPDAYLIKPFNSSELIASLELAFYKHDLKNSSVKNTLEELTIKDENKYVQINLNEILFVESIGNYVNIRTRIKKHRYRSTIKNLLLQLPANQFLQTHRGFVVNNNEIKESNSSFVIVGETKIPISRKYAHQFSLKK